MGAFTKAGRRVDRGVDTAMDSVLTLLDDLDDVVKDRSADLSALKSTLTTRLAQARTALGDSPSTVKRHFDQALASTDETVHNRPWEAIGAVAGLAFVLGIIVGRSA